MISRINIEDMTDAQDEALLPCPFCGGKAEVFHIGNGPNQGGSCVSCANCLASSNLEFGFKENFRNNWNRRADLARPSQAGDERVARLLDVACGATTMIAHALDDGHIDEEVAGNFEALLTELNDAIAAMDTPKGGGDE